MKNYIIIIITSLTFLLNSCGGCEYFEKKETEAEYHFKIDSINIQGPRTFYMGKDKSNSIFLQSFSEIDKYAEKGDSISKTIGTNEFLLIKKDTTMHFYFDCDDRFR